MNREEYYYYATCNGIPIYYQPETTDIIPRNKICDWLMDIQEYFWNIFGTPEEIKIVIYKKTITKQKIEKKLKKYFK